MDYSWLGQNWMELARLIGSSILALGVWLAFLNLRNSRIAAQISAKQSELSTRQQEVAILSQVQDRWNSIYETRNKLRTTKFHLVNWAGMEPEEILKHKDWIEIVRPVANFYEFVGLIISKGYIAPETALVLVTADRASRMNASPLIDALRSKYRDDLYLFWDELIEIGERVEALTPRQLPKVGG